MEFPPVDFLNHHSMQGLRAFIIEDMSDECLFCQIVDGSRTAGIVMETDQVLAFLDNRPIFPGHCLLIPKVHIETLSDLPARALGGFFEALQLLARAVETALAADGSFVAINNRVSQSVPHLHVHVVPRRKKDGLRGFFWPRGKYADEEEMEKMQTIIREAVKRLWCSAPGGSPAAHLENQQKP